MVVGPDEVIPQARIPDKTAIGNESDYADDATIDRNGDGVPDDSAVSAAFRLGYMLSDDPYGDFDPTEHRASRPTSRSAAWSRRRPRSRRRSQAFLDADGVVAAAALVRHRLRLPLRRRRPRSSTRSPARCSDGASQSRIDETWTAADAQDGLNAPGAGFLSVNAHYDHYRALPAAAFNGTSPNLLPASQTNAARRQRRLHRRLPRRA